jgi:hypothetical protein
VSREKKIRGEREITPILGKSLGPNDRLSITLFNNNATILLPLIIRPSLSELALVVQKINTGGGTSIMAGLISALSDLIFVVERDEGDGGDGDESDTDKPWGDHENEKGKGKREKREKGGSTRTAMVLLLSDGQDNCQTDFQPLIQQVDRLADRQVLNNFSCKFSFSFSFSSFSC